MKKIEDVKDLVIQTLNQKLNLHLYLGVDDKEIKDTHLNHSHDDDAGDDDEAGGVSKKSNREIKYLLADLDGKSTASILEEYAGSIIKYFDNSDLSLLPLSDVDGRSDVLLQYDFKEEPPAFSHLLKLLDKKNPPKFNFSKYSILDVKSFAIKISSPKLSILFFKKLYPVSLIKQGQILIMKTAERFQHVPSDILKISGGFDLMVLNDNFYITSLKKFESSFGFDQIAKKVQVNTSKNILALGIVDDVQNYLANGIAPKRDMLRVAKSEIVSSGGVGILAFVQNNQTRFKLTIVNGKIQLTSRDSVKTFIKMLNDDYLKSDITGNNYDSLAKDKMP